MTLRFPLFFIIISLAILSILLSLSKGSASNTLYQLFMGNQDQLSTIFLHLRLPRTLTAFVCGGLLALAGALMQLLLENPLADPYVLGVSGGAAFFTLLFTLLGLSEQHTLAGAWIGSAATIGLVFLFARKNGYQSYRLLLAGIAMACGFSALISILLLITPPASMHGLLFWLSGDLNGAGYPWLSGSILLIGMMMCWLLAPGLNILARGENESKALGLSTNKYRLIIFLLSSIFTSGAVTIAGCIGFIGLIVPHLARSIVGYDHRSVLPASMLLGGTLVTFADTCARSLFAPLQLPVGMLIALAGIPLFIWIIHR